MRLLNLLLAILVILIPAQASAETISASGKITVRAIVDPARTILINNSGAIVEIDSNTTEDVLPRVFQNSISSSTEKPLTEQVLNQYRIWLPKDFGVGIIKIQPIGKETARTDDLKYNLSLIR